MYVYVHITKLNDETVFHKNSQFRDKMKFS